MLSLPPSVRLFVATQPVDGRKGIDSLTVIVDGRLAANAIEAAELALIVEGIDLQGARRRPRWEPRATRPTPALSRSTG